MNGSQMLQFLENSSNNGFGFMVVVVLFYLFIFFLAQYFQHRKLFFLLYSAYTFVTGFGLLRYIDGVFFSDYFHSVEGKMFIGITHYPSQMLGTLLFMYFIITIMRLKERFPKSIQIINYCFGITSLIYLVLWGVHVVFPKSPLIDYLHAFVYIPTGYFIFFWILHMVFQQKSILRKYIFSGMLVLGTTYLLLFLISAKNSDINNYLYIFYIGVLIESLLFALAVGMEQKLVYVENMEVHKKYIAQLEENQVIKDSMNRALSTELAQTKSSILELTEEAQRERTEKLTFAFESKFSQLRLEALRSQMSPHFIFNAMNSIKSYFIDNERDKALYFLSKFSKLIRKILESSRKEQISLTEELKMISLYIEIEKNRFKNDITFTTTTEAGIDTEKLMVPPLVLQPFVENAIWHGLLTKEGEKLLFIKIAKSVRPKTIEIRIEDNGIGRQEAQQKNAMSVFKKESLGLVLLKDTLKLFSKKMGRTYSFHIEDLYNQKGDRSRGTSVTIYIPF